MEVFPSQELNIGTMKPPENDNGPYIFNSQLII